MKIENLKQIGVSELTWIALSVALTAIAVYPGHGVEGLGYLAYSGPKALSLGLCALGLALAWRRTPDKRIYWADLGIAAYLLIGFASCLANKVPWFLVLDWIGPLAAGLLLFVSASRLTKEEEKFLFSTIIITAAVIAIVVFLEATGVPIPWSLVRRPTSTLGHRNFVAAYCAIVLPLAIAKFSPKPRPVALMLWTALGVVIVLCRSRGVWLSVASAVPITFCAAHFSQNRSGKKNNVFKYKPFVFALLLALTLSLFLAAKLTWRGLHWDKSASLSNTARREFDFKSGSGGARLNNYRLAAVLMENYGTLGVGPGKWSVISPSLVHQIPGMHNSLGTPQLYPNSDFARIGAETGIFSLLACIGILFCLFTGALRRIRDSDSLPIALALIASLAISVGFALSEAPLMRLELIALLAPLAGILRKSSPAMSLELPIANSRAFACGLAFLAIALAGFRLAGMLPITEGVNPTTLHASESRFPNLWAAFMLVDMSPAKKEECETIRADLEKALKLHPYQYGFWWKAAGCASLKGDPITAETAYEKAVAIEPHDAKLVEEAKAMAVQLKMAKREVPSHPANDKFSFNKSTTSP